jgi:flagellar FliL protein
MADEKDLEGDENEGGGGKKKLIIIIVAAVLLLTVIGVAVVMLLGGGDEAADGEEAAQEEVVRHDPLYYAFEPQFVVNLPPGGKARMLQVSLQVMAHDQAVIDYMQANDPMLRHHMFNLFSSQDSSILYQRKGREALARAVEKLLERKMKENDFEADVQAVYFSELVLQ